MNKFQLGDIICCTMYDAGDLLITAKEEDHYKARYINGKFHGKIVCVYDEKIYYRKDNIFNRN